MATSSGDVSSSRQPAEKENAGRSWLGASAKVVSRRLGGRGVLHWGETFESLFIMEGLTGPAREERLGLAERVQQRPDDATAWWALLVHVSQQGTNIQPTSVCRLYRRATQCIPKNRPELNESEAYISIWLGYAREQTKAGRREDAQEALRYMRNEGIGRRSSAFYRAWAECEVGAGRPATARDALYAGVKSVPASRRRELSELLAMKGDAELVAALLAPPPGAEVTSETTANLADDEASLPSAASTPAVGARPRPATSLRREDIGYMLKWKPKAAAGRRVNFADDAAAPNAGRHIEARAHESVPQHSRGSTGSSSKGDSDSDSSDDGRPQRAASSRTPSTTTTSSSSLGSRPAAIEKDEEPTAPNEPVADDDAFLGLVSTRNVVRVEGVPYAKLALIGRGGSSKVFRVLDPEGHIMALKRVRLRGPEARDSLAGYANEITLLRRLRGKPGIISLHVAEIDEDAGSINLVMEAGDADLATVLARRRNESTDAFPPLKHVNFVRLAWQQMLEAVHTIHEERIVHGDLKPANFLFVQGRLQLIDFGIARAIKNDTTNVYRDAQIGTLNYMSPEAIRDTNAHSHVGQAGRPNQPTLLKRPPQRRKPTMRVGRASDVWSLGCILYQMVYGRPPFGHLHLYAKLQAICNPNHEIDLPDAPLASDDALNCLRGCLQREPTARPPIAGSGGLLTHRFLEPRHEDALPTRNQLRLAFKAAWDTLPTPDRYHPAKIADALHASLVALQHDDTTDLLATENPPPRRNRRRSIVDRFDRRMLPLAEEAEAKASPSNDALA